MVVPYEDHEVDLSSCYVMPIVLEDPKLRDSLRQHLLERHRVQTSVLYPAIHEFSAYAGEAHAPLPRANSSRGRRSRCLSIPTSPSPTRTV